MLMGMLLLHLLQPRHRRKHNGNFRNKLLEVSNPYPPPIIEGVSSLLVPRARLQCREVLPPQCDIGLGTFKSQDNVHTILKIHPQVLLHRHIFNQSTWFDAFPLHYCTALR